MSVGGYVAGVVELAIVLGSLGFAATRLRARLLPAWEGAPARLAEAILGVALLVWVGELLGVVGLLREGSLVVACACVGAGSLLARPGPRGGAPPARPVAPLAMLVAVGVVALLFAHWGLQTKVALNNGVNNFDSLWYHLPYAADIAQSGSVTGFHHTDTVFLNWFYPQNSELIHAMGMLVWDRDTLSLFINLGWLALILLAAWCIGRPWGRGPHCIAAAALVLEAHTLIFREPGSGKNDVVAAAFVLSAIALLVSGWAAQRSQTRTTNNEQRGTALSIRMDPRALAIAGLAAGLAVGTKLTVLATVAALTLVVFALPAAGARLRALGIWIVPLLAGGAYWYLRNLIAVGNPLPQVQHLGPLTLPGPERLQTARPDFPIVHYATDTGVWRAYFGPGLHEAFGGLWPLVLAAAFGGAVLAIARSGERLLQLLGGAALFGLAAYLITPLSAAGEQGAPIAFAINIRFAIPALVIGLALLPLGRGLQGRRAAWGLLVALLVVLVITDRSDAVLREPERAFGVLVALLLIGIPAPGAFLRERQKILASHFVAAGFAALALLVAAIGYPVQRDYLNSRWRDFDPPQHLDSAYRWAGDVRDARIGLAGTTTGFLGYGFYGKDLSNRVIYLGREDPHGSFNAIRTCSAFRRAVNAADLDYLVTGPFLNFAHQGQPIYSPEFNWVRSDPALRVISRDGTGKARVTVFKVGGKLDPPAVRSSRWRRTTCRSRRPQGSSQVAAPIRRRLTCRVPWRTMELPARERALPVGGGLSAARGAARRPPRLPAGRPGRRCDPRRAEAAHRPHLPRRPARRALRRGHRLDSGDRPARGLRRPRGPGLAGRRRLLALPARGQRLRRRPPGVFD